MRLFESRILWGGLLIIAGLMFLAQNLGYLQIGVLFWLAVFLTAGLLFLAFFIQNRTNWWALIPAMTLLSLALVVIMKWAAPALGGDWEGAIVLFGIGIGFLLSYIVERRNWWAIIPAGVLITLAIVARIDEYEAGMTTAGLFFLGLGLTFGLVALLPTPQGEMRWAWIPSGILMLIGGLLLIAREDLLAYLWPAALILAGGFLVVWSLRR